LKTSQSLAKPLKTSHGAKRDFPNQIGTLATASSIPKNYQIQSSLVSFRHVSFELESRQTKPETLRVRWKKVTLVGVGLLGGSLGQALKQRRLAGSVVGFVRRRASLNECRKYKAVDVATLDLRQAVEGADLVVLCTPISRMKSLLKDMSTVLKPGAIVTDVGSVKGTVVRELESLAAKAGACFVGSHPMAGAEKMGVAWARADLFEGAVCVVTSTRKSNPGALRKVEALWKSVGCRVMKLSPELHDELVSRTSHLPHLIAAALVNAVLSTTHRREQDQLCANGFRNTTRIASGSPEMWRDIALANRRNLAPALRRFIKDLNTFHRQLVKGDAIAVSRFFERAKRSRDLWVKKARSGSADS
jgi:prephenate dehydrogenase